MTPIRTRRRIAVPRFDGGGPFAWKLEHLVPEPGGNPLRGKGKLTRILPVTAIAAFGLLVLGWNDHGDHVLHFVGLGLFILETAMALSLPWERLPVWSSALVPLSWMAIPVVLAESAPMLDSAYSTLLIIPLIWIALFEDRRTLFIGLGLAIGILLIPHLVDRDFGHEFQFDLVASVVVPPLCLLIRTLVATIQGQRSRLEELVLLDPLTSVGNRRRLELELRRDLARAKRDGSPLCLALIDLDNFKEFNDLHGHPTGDALLMRAAEDWSGLLRQGDLIARYGGEEFVVVLPDSSLDEAVEVVRRLSEVVPFEQTFSAGVAVWDGFESGPHLVARADAAMYSAKKAGRNRIVSVANPLPSRSA